MTKRLEFWDTRYSRNDLRMAVRDAAGRFDGATNTGGFVFEVWNTAQGPRNKWVQRDAQGRLLGATNVPVA